MRIGIDIDDTLSKTFEAIYPYALEYFKIPNLKRDNQTLRETVTSYGLDYTKFCKEYYDKVLPDAEVMEGASEILNKLKKEGHEIIIVTARTDKAYNYPYETSYKFLIKHNIPFDKLLVGHPKKGKICKLENIDLFIDDNVDNCYDISKYGIDVLLYNSPLNKNNHDFKRVNNFKEIYDYVKKVENGKNFI